MKKILTTLTLAALMSGQVSATQVYYDDGVDDGGSASTATGLFDSLSFVYTSTSVVTDVDASTDLSVGDTIMSSGGTVLFGSTLDAINASNVFTNFNPFGADSDGYGPGNWVLTFGFSNLFGTFDGTFFDYTSGDIAVKAYDYGTGTTTEILTLTLTGSVSGIPNTDYFGVTSVTNDFFYLANGKSFQQSINDGDTPRFAIAQNTNPSLSGQALIDALGNFVGSTNLGGQHSGTLRFNVPEPSTVAILGLALVGVSVMSRRKKLK